MGLVTVVVTDENGNRRGEAISLSTDLLPRFEDERFGLLRFVDPYGDTVFNRVQMPFVLEELQMLKEVTLGREKCDLIDRVAEFASQCERGPHLYLKFIGD